MIYYDELNASYAAATVEERAEMVRRCLKWFIETDDTIQRNQLSLFFCDNNIIEAVSHIIRIATDHKFSNVSDTLMYSLTEYKDISLTFDDLMKFVPIVASGSFLASRHSYLVIEKYVQSITSAETEKMCNSLNQHIQNGCPNADFAQDLLDYLISYNNESPVDNK